MPDSLKEQLEARKAALMELKKATEALLKGVEQAEDKNGEGSHTLSPHAIEVSNKKTTLLAACEIEYPTVTIDETEYEIVKPSIIRNGRTMTAEELSADEATAAELIEENSQILTPSVQVVFTYNINNPTTEDTIEFGDETEGAVAWLWDFGGIDTATIKRPLYIFSQPGEYKVTLTVTLDNGRTKTASQVITVTLPS